MNFVRLPDIDGWSVVGRCLQCLDTATGRDAVIYAYGAWTVAVSYTGHEFSKRPITLAAAIVTLVSIGFPRPPQVLLKQFIPLVR